MQKLLKEWQAVLKKLPNAKAERWQNYWHEKAQYVLDEMRREAWNEEEKAEAAAHCFCYADARARQRKADKLNALIAKLERAISKNIGD